MFVFRGLREQIIDKEVLSIFGSENEVLKQCGIAKERFHKVRGVQWEGVYQEIAQRFADKKKIWKNGRERFKFCVNSKSDIR